MSQVSGQRPLVSFIIATHNRVETLLHTLERVEACGLGCGEYEVIVVDNASTDGTPERLRRSKPDMHLIALDRNRGSCAKSLALAHARGEYVVFLDDDSYPLDESVRKMIRRFEDDPALGAAGFVVHLPDGGQESSALPNVFVGCGVGFRREVLIRVGGLDLSYFMQAEEYDLSFRLARAGYSVRTFDDLYVMHLKDNSARSRDRTRYLDLRNNLMLAATYLPSPWHREFIRDWVQRYHWLAGNKSDGRTHPAGRASGLLRGYFRRFTRPGSRLDHQMMDNMFGIGLIATATAQLAEQGFSRALFADLGKNIYPYYRAARRAGVEVLAVMDDGFARPGRRYRGVPLVTDQHGLTLPAEAVIVSNSSPVHARATETRLRSRTDLPIHRWHGRFEFDDAEVDPERVQFPRYQTARSGAP